MHDQEEPSSGITDASDFSTNFLTCPAVPELPAPASLPEQVPEPSFVEPDAPVLVPTPTFPETVAADLPEGEPERVRLPWGWIWTTVFLGCLIALGPLVYGGVQAGLAARRAEQALRAARTAAETRDVALIQESVATAKAEAGRIRDGVEATLFWRNVPYVGTHLRAAEDAGEAGIAALGSVEEILQAAGEIQSAFASVGVGFSNLAPGVSDTRAFKDLSREEKRAIVARIAGEIPRLKVADEKARIALESWNRIPQSDLAGPIQRALAPVTQALEEYQRTMEGTVALADTLLPLTGYPERKTYLALLQNANELRPTGGFIGNIGTIVVDQGELVRKDFQDVYDIDRLVINRWREPLPEPIKRYMQLDAWYFRDGNWSPDFPTTAEKLLDLYNRQHLQAGAVPTEFNGVIAFNPGLFRELLLLVGPLETDGKTFHAENFFDEIQYAVEVEFNELGIPWDRRKDLVKRLGDQLTDRLFSLPARDWPKLLEVVTRSLARKDIMIYDRDPAFLKKLDAKHWTGRVQSPSGDYVWVVDANMGALKTDGAMDKEIRYEIDATGPGAPIAKVTLVYRNTHVRSNTADNWRFSRYRDYVRIYVPEGSELVTSAGSEQRVEVYREFGKTVFGAFWTIEPNTTKQMTFQYRLPMAIGDQIRAGTYRFYAQKQPGARARLTVRGAFDKKVSFAEPGEDPSDFGDALYEWSGELQTDRPMLIRF